MLVVKIELHSAITGRVSELGRMQISNTGKGSYDRGDYAVEVLRRSGVTGGAVTRTGEVKNYPRLSYNVWRLVSRALRSAFPEEK